MRFAALVALLAALSVLLWWLPNRPQLGDVPMPVAKFNSLSFAPYHDGQSPVAERFPSAAQVETDLALLARYTRTIRTYAAIEGDYDTDALAQQHGLKVWQGIWLGPDPAANAREIEAGIALARRYPDTVQRVVVGNEVLLRHDLPPEALIAALDQVRAAVHQPVTYAEVWEYWLKFPQIADHVDIMTLHLLPYWEDSPTGIATAVAHVGAVYDRMAALFPGKAIAIGETGWPSRGRWRQGAAPGVVNQALFLRRFAALATARGWDYNIIEAFDQGWKYQDEGVVGANWGVLTAARTEKYPWAGPVTEDPLWPQHAALQVAVALLVLGFAAGCGGRIGGGAAAAAFVLAGGVAFAQAATAPELYDVPARLAAVVDLSGQVLLAALLVRRLAFGPPSAWRTGAQATDAVRGLLLLGWPPGAGPTELVDDLSFVFVWVAAVQQLLLVTDPRYRDFPMAEFAVPVLAVPMRAMARDLPLHGGGREELLAGLVLAGGAVAGAVQEGWLNRQSLTWSAAALLLAAPPLLRCYRRASRQPPSQPQAPSAAPAMPQVTL